MFSRSVKLFVGTGIVLLGFTATAAQGSPSLSYKEYGITSSLGDFAAPVVPDVSNVSNMQTGTIVYDVNSGNFRGFNGQGDWDTLTVTDAVLTTTGVNQRIEHAQVNPLSGSSCTIGSDGGGGWIASTTPNGVGDCTVNFVSGVFSDIPVCVVSVEGNTTMTLIQAARTADHSSSSVRIITNATTGGTVAANAQSVNLICKGTITVP